MVKIIFFETSTEFGDDQKNTGVIFQTKMNKGRQVEML